MNAGEPLVSAIDEIAIATKFAITTRAAEKTDAYAVADGPAVNPVAHGIYASDNFVAGDPRKIDGKECVDRARVRVANATCLHTNSDLTRTGISQRFRYNREFSGFRDLNCFVGRAHIPPP